MRRVLSFLLVVLACSFATGCWQARDTLSAPDLSEQNGEVDETITRLKRIQGTMRGELDALKRDKQAFFETPPTTWARPFPLDTFKHAAMSCLNEPYTDREPEPTAREAARNLGVSCAVPSVIVLDRLLSEVATVRDTGMQKLQQVDGLRALRARLQSRLRQLPAIVRRTRNYLATRRAEARQMEKEIERRQPEYSRKSFDEALDVVARYRVKLDELEDAIDEVEASIPRWSRALGTVVDALYKDLSRLGRT